MNASTISEYHLQNGLTVILINDPLTDIASIRTYVKAGSIDENSLLGSGASHYLEHLVAGGTTSKRSEDDYKSKIALLGGAFNAYTTLDHTSYFINTTSEYISDAISILSEWMFYSSFTDKEFNRERDVIIKEIEKNNAHNGRKFYQAAQENFYKHHPIQYPVIGYLENFKKIQKHELINYYKTYYVPSNIILVVGGNFNENNILTKIESEFGSEKSVSKPIRPITYEPLPFSTRIFEKNDTINVTNVSIRFSTIDLFSKDLYPLDLLDYLMGNGEDSILYRFLVEKEKLAYSIHASSFTPDFTTGYFEISGEIDYKNKDKFIQRVYEILDEIKSGKHLDLDRIQSAKKQKIADKILSISTIEDKVSEFGLGYLYAYNIHFYDDYANRFKTVTKKDLTTAAQQYFVKEKSVTTIIAPNEHKKNTTTSNSKADKPSPIVKQLDNGLKIIMIQDASIPKTLCQIMTIGGLRSETPSKNGLGNLTVNLLGKKSEKYSKDQILKLIDGNGADMGGSMGQNTIYYTLECLSEDFPTLFPVFLDTFCNAKFTQFEFDESKRKILQSISQRKDEWSSFGNYHFRKTFYGNHPYGLASIGEKETIEKLSINDVKTYYKSMINPSQTILTFIGDFNPSDIEKQFSTITSHFNKTGHTNQALNSRIAHTKKQENIVEIPQDVAAVFIGFDGTTLNNTQDLLKLDLVDSVLSGLQYPGGRLHNILREKGLVYMVHATNQAGIEPGCFQIIALTSKDKAEEVKKIIFEQITDIQTKAISDQEFNEAIAQMSFYYKDRVASNESLATIMASDELFGRGHLYYKSLQESVPKLTKEDILNTSKKYLKNPQIFIFQNK